MDLFQRMYEIGLIPAVTIDREQDAVPLAKALNDGGLPACEITYRTSAAPAAIRAIRKAYPDMLVGAGTVLTPAQADSAKDAGAEFVVAPGCNPTVIRRCKEIGLAILPGCASPSDIETALELGIDTVKFFPAEAMGGVATLKALAGPYGNVRFLPTGGVDENNLLTYLNFKKVIACGGSFMVKKDVIEAGDFAKVTELTQNAVAAILGFRVVHVGINADSPERAFHIVDQFAPFGFPVKDGNSSVFLGKDVEVMKKPWYGKLGHIAVETNNIIRAEAFLRWKGLSFLEETKKVDEKGNYGALYIDGDFGGFAVHLVQKR